MNQHKRLRRVLTVGVAGAVLAATSVAAYAATAKPNAAKLSGTLSMYVVQGMPFKSAIDDFKAKNPDVDIKLSFGPPGPGYGQGLVTLIQAGNAPDIFYVNPGTGAVQATGLLGPEGRIVNLADQPWVKRIKPPAKQLWVQSKNGKPSTVWALPVTVQGVGITYNDTEFKKLGLTPPKTFAQLLTVCGKIRAAGKQPMLISGQSPIMPLMNRAITQVYAKDPTWNAKRAARKVTFAGTASWVKTFNDFKRLQTRCFAPQYVGLSVPQVFAAMAAGDALMAQLPTGATNVILTLNPSLSMKAIPFPGDTVKDTIAQAYWTDALAISSASKNIPVAKAFLNFFSGTYQQAGYAKQSFTIAPVQAATGQNIPAFMSAFAPYFKSGKVMQRPYDVWSQPGPYLAMQTNITAFLLGKMTARQALAGVDRSWGKATAQ